MTSTHGGKRPGAGAKPSGRPPRRTVSSSFSDEEIEVIDAKADKAGISRAQGVRIAVIKWMGRRGE